MHVYNLIIRSPIWLWLIFRFGTEQIYNLEFF